VFEQEKRSVPKATFAKYLGVDPDALPEAERALFEERIRYFLTDSESDERIAVRLAGQSVRLPETNRGGYTRAACVLGDLLAAGVGSRVNFSLEAPGHRQHDEGGSAVFVAREGVSVVSDIDDTIKISNVLDRDALLRATFLEPFRAAPGMAAWYRELAERPGTSFHYLSASPMQLYPALAAFVRREGFPDGSFHLRETTSWTAIFATDDSGTHKMHVLSRLLAESPQRQFILVGDSGERDPEIYADIARAHPERILAIHIRDVTSEGRDAPRYQKTFAGIPAGLWRLRAP
jgi:phosphatidate phosphatase APP1